MPTKYERSPCGLAEQGFSRGEHLALAATTVRAFTPRSAPRSASAACRFPCTRTPSPRRLRFPIQNAEIAFAFAEDQEQVDKAARDPAAVPDAEAHLLRRPRGMRHYAHRS